MFDRSPWPLVAAILVTLTVGAVSLVTRDDRPSAPGPITANVAGPQYVAIGDSFTAGGRIKALQQGGENCLRSTENYPSIVARELGYSLTDVSCFGASTKDVLQGDTGVKPQVDALNAETSLVTVSIGGNDLGVYSTIFLTCIRTSRPGGVGAPCQAQFDRSFRVKVDQAGRRVGEVLDEVRRRAPKARILVITYLSLMPNDLACAATPFSERDVLWFAGVETRLAGAVSAAAEQRDIEVIDMHAASLDHNVCAGAKAWVNGPRPKESDGILFHPNGAGERAIAAAVVTQLRSEPPGTK